MKVNVHALYDNVVSSYVSCTYTLYYATFISWPFLELPKMLH